jgi:hypothetical protein
MSYQYRDLVDKAFHDLKAEGLIAPRAYQEQVEQDKGLLTRRAAWYINQQRDPTIGLLEKTSGNNSLGYSVDWHLRRTNGDGVDVATDRDAGGGMREACPVDGDWHGPNPESIPLWRPPTAELAQMPDGGTEPGPEPGPEPTPPPDYDARLAAIEAALNTVVQIVTQNHEMAYHMMTQTWSGESALALKMNFGIKCPPMPTK